MDTKSTEYSVTITSKIDPLEFDVTVGALLIGIGAETYIDIFRKHNIGQCTLLELTDADLIKLGINDEEIRNKLLAEVKNLPISEDHSNEIAKSQSSLGPLEIIDVLQETSKHLHRIYLSMLANTLAVKKTKNIQDSLIYKDKYASDVALSTLTEINDILNSMDITIYTEMKGLTKKSSATSKKLFIGTIGSAVIAVLAMLFTRSLKQLG